MSGASEFPILVPFVDRLEQFPGLPDLVAAYVQAVTEAERLAAVIAEAREERRPPADPDCEHCLGSAERIVMIGCPDPEPSPVACNCIRFSPEPTIAVCWSAF